MFSRNQSIRRRIINFSFLITLVPLLVLELFFLVLIQRNTFRTVMDTVSAYADQLAYNYQKELDKLEHLALAISNFTSLEEYLKLEFADDGETFAYYIENIHPFLVSCDHAYDGTRIKIYHDRKDIRNFSSELNNGLKEFEEKIFPQGISNIENETWRYSDFRYSAFRSAFSYCMVDRRSAWPHEISCLITIHMDEELFYSQIAREPPEDRIVFVTDKEGHIITSNQRENVRRSMDELGLPEKLVELDFRDREIIAVNGRSYSCIYRETEDLNIIYMVSYSSILSAQYISMIILVAAGGLLFLLSSWMIFRISGEITSDISRLKEKMQNIDLESIHTLAVSPAHEESRDEIKQLDAVFSGMMARIEGLMKEVQQQEHRFKDEVIIRQQAEIQALQRQIDPHYLFNTLEAIRMNLVLKNDRENAEIVKLFAESFRRYVDMRADEATLLEEVDFIQKYIRIQNYRLDNKIRFTCIAKEKVLGHRVMKLLLQPLIENAVCHGVEPKEAGGEILLRIEEKGEELIISVEDDGIGMKEEQLEKLRQTVYGDEPQKSVGLHNVYHRIRLVYGERARLDIDSTEQAGTRIRMVLPLEKRIWDK